MLKQCSRKELCVNQNGISGWLNIEQFSTGKGNKDGLQSRCKACCNEWAKEWGIGYRKSIIGKFKKVTKQANTNSEVKMYYKQVICLFCSQLGTCPVLKKPLNFKNMSFDHIKSTFTGGSNTPDNLIFVRGMVNLGKNGFGLNKFLYEFDIPKEPVWQRIKEAHQVYDYNIDRFTLMTDKELELEVQKVLSLTNSI